MAAIPILVIAVVQGWLLYGLHYSLEHKTWPATEPGWLVACYAIALFVPVSLQIFAGRLRERLTWLLAGGIAFIAGGLGGYGGWVAEPEFGLLLTLYGALLLAWFIALPFVQARARRGTWRVSYPDLFEFSWQNALLLAEASLFTGVFWLLLFLWGALFKVIEISFFAELFNKPAFIYPVTSIAFGYAIYLIESHEKIVITLRRHLLGVFSWLLPLVALIAALFLLALPFTGLQPLWKTGHATALMLWLQVFFIHFLNSAYEDGQAEPRYPGWLKLVLRLAIFALPIYAALCAYSLGLRVDQHGWTVSRVWAAIGTFIAALYGVGYAAAALRRSPWMARMAPINVGLAAVVAGVLLLAISPILDPKRISSRSQVERLRSGAVAPAKFDYDYLHFELGRYGKDALAMLAKDPSKEVAELAAAALDKARRYGSASMTPEMMASRIHLHPAGTAIDPAFVKYLERAVREQRWQHPSCLSQIREEPCLMVALDLNADGSPEILTLGSYPQTVYGRVEGQWKMVGTLAGPANRQQAEAAIRQARVKGIPPLWLDVTVGDVRYTMQNVPR
ncbi:MAG TPA: DUF4153 domain-containing protein [Burkholderiales bacterium]|nr:DUF4153 domain-containing protein [Burkholderiales bacterium]